MNKVRKKMFKKVLPRSQSLSPRTSHRERIHNYSKDDHDQDSNSSFEYADSHVKLSTTSDHPRRGRTTKRMAPPPPFNLLVNDSPLPVKPSRSRHVSADKVTLHFHPKGSFSDSGRELSPKSSPAIKSPKFKLSLTSPLNKRKRSVKKLKENNFAKHASDIAKGNNNHRSRKQGTVNLPKISEWGFVLFPEDLQTEVNYEVR